MPDGISLEALMAGDRAEFARLVDMYSSPIYRLGLRMLGNPQDAEDVLQNTFINALTHIRHFEGRSGLGTWLFRIASNEALMLIRAESPILLLRPTAPLALAEIAEQALELGGSRVYTTAGQVRNALTTYLWGNRGGLPLPGSPTITGMPARLAVMPKQPATLTVATVVTPVAAEARRAPRGSWRRHAIAVGFGIVAVLLIAGIWMRGSAPFIGTTATPALPAAGTLPSSTSTVAPSPVSATPAGPAPENAGSDATRAVPLVAGAAPAHNAAPRGAAAAGQGIVALAVSPWGSVFVNGEPRGTTPPLNQITLPAGRHAIEIRNGNQAPYVAQVDVTPERPQQLRHRFE